MSRAGRAALIVLAVSTLICQTAPVSAAPSPTPCTAAPAQCDPQQAALLTAVRQQLGATLAEAVATEYRLDGSLRAAAYEEEQLTTMITSADETIAQLNSRIVELQVEIDTTSRRIKLERAQIAALARTIYAQPQSMLLLLAESRNLGEALNQTSRYVLAGSNAQRLKTQLADDLKREQTDVQQEQLARDQQQREKLAVQSLFGRSITLQSLATAYGEQLQHVVAQINQELAAVGTQSPALANQLKNQLSYQVAAMTQEANQVTSQHLQLILQLPTQARSQIIDWASVTVAPAIRRARLVWPMANAILTQGFGPSSLAVEPPMMGYAHFHSGIDLAAPVNSPVLAAGDGVVTVVGWDPWGYGRYVVVSHGGGLATVYGHLNAVTAATGQTVIAGERIGLEGSTGISTGPHLHFEVRLNGTPVNPLTYLTAS